MKLGSNALAGKNKIKHYPLTVRRRPNRPVEQELCHGFGCTGSKYRLGCLRRGTSIPGAVWPETANYLKRIRITCIVCQLSCSILQDKHGNKPQGREILPGILKSSLDSTGQFCVLHMPLLLFLSADNWTDPDCDYCLDELVGG